MLRSFLLIHLFFILAPAEAFNITICSEFRRNIALDIHPVRRQFVYVPKLETLGLTTTERNSLQPLVDQIKKSNPSDIEEMSNLKSKVVLEMWKLLIVKKQILDGQFTNKLTPFAKGGLSHEQIKRILMSEHGLSEIDKLKGIDVTELKRLYQLVNPHRARANAVAEELIILLNDVMSAAVVLEANADPKHRDVYTANKEQLRTMMSQAMQFWLITRGYSHSVRNRKVGEKTYPVIVLGSNIPFVKAINNYDVEVVFDASQVYESGGYHDEANKQLSIGVSLVRDYEHKEVLVHELRHFYFGLLRRKKIDSDFHPYVHAVDGQLLPKGRFYNSQVSTIADAYAENISFEEQSTFSLGLTMVRSRLRAQTGTLEERANEVRRSLVRLEIAYNANDKLGQIYEHMADALQYMRTGPEMVKPANLIWQKKYDKILTEEPVQTGVPALFVSQEKYISFEYDKVFNPTSVTVHVRTEKMRFVLPYFSPQFMKLLFPLFGIHGAKKRDIEKVFLVLEAQAKRLSDTNQTVRLQLETILERSYNFENDPTEEKYQLLLNAWDRLSPPAAVRTLYRGE